ncbi:gluconokinase [Alteromonas pelagimontana]|uniref:Gluconokinase n=1 Tax=Alteromonas pelagimontana TaxID=1858656 RepID=A0A6M4MD96_9ALTE|nr:gluconokinase [Alteromonas pelagimontana]QJR81103.1 gluconokinase [Alteromonas pelagimontana]
MNGLSIIVMGVSGSGKSSVGEALARKLHAKFIDGDDLHPKANILKMAGGEPLNDNDRQPWLERIRDAVFSLESKNETGVIVCSALKKSYRDQIRDGNKNLLFLFLEGSKALVAERMLGRQGHFMKPAMLDSQFATLEIPGSDEPDVISVSIVQNIEDIVAKASEEIAAQRTR